MRLFAKILLLIFTLFITVVEAKSCVEPDTYNANLMLSANRWGFNGKEKQTTGNINYMDYGARMYDDFTGRWFVQDPLQEKYYPFSSYTFSANNPLRFVDPNGMDVYRYDYKTGEMNLFRKTDDNFDQIGKFKYDKKTDTYTLKEKKDGTAKTRINNVEKGILSNGMNFKENNNVIAVGGERQATEAGVESFVLQLSDMVGKEIGGAYFSKDGATSTTHMSIGMYKNNSISETKSYGHMSWSRLYPDANMVNSITGFFHTHPSNGYSESARTNASPPDKTFKNNALKHNPVLKFFILTQPIQYRGTIKFPY